ncbi:MAG: MerR family DNA-binding transcriptional regulator [Candidatus Limivicinus sp.]|nr:MerR family DNA-binding transcriptional regulator [Candidatus Limivicinus sp.]
MDLQKLSIGQMAELNHVSEQTLRLYDKEGLLVPRCVDPVTGYRYYHIIQSAKLDLIQNMKIYGMTLRQIRSFLDNNDPAALREMLSEQAASIEERIRQLRRSQSAITRTLDNYRRYEAMPRNGEIFLEYIPERRIFRYSCEVNYFDQDESGYEYMLRQMKTNLVANNMPLSYFTNIGTIIRREHLVPDALFSNEVFLFVDEDDSSQAMETLPAASYLCLCSDEFSMEAANVRRLLDYVQTRGCEIAGDYICEVVVDFPMLDFDRRRMFYKAQIPVRFFG